MSKKELIKRYTLLVIGLFIMALGVALSTKANLGTSPISCIPYVLCLGLPLTFGQLTFIVNFILIIAQFIILGRDFRLLLLLQIPAVFIFSVFTDFTMHLVSGIQADHLLSQWLLLSASNIVLAFGVSLEVIANVTMLPGEGVVMAISKASGKEFGRIKVCFDLSLVAIGSLFSYYLFYKLNGVREGTIASSLTLGIIVRFFIQKLQAVNGMLVSRPRPVKSKFKAAEFSETI